MLKISRSHFGLVMMLQRNKPEEESCKDGINVILADLKYGLCGRSASWRVRLELHCKILSEG